jgi:hypothetical protein
VFWGEAPDFFWIFLGGVFECWDGMEQGGFEAGFSELGNF